MESKYTNSSKINNEQQFSAINKKNPGGPGFNKMYLFFNFLLLAT